VKNAAAIRTLGKRLTADIIEIGRLLTESKEILGHGNFLPWIECEFGWADRTAERFMQVYRLSGKIDKLSNLEVPITGLYLLAAPSTPEEARKEMIERTESGETISNDQLKEIIEKHKAPPETGTSSSPSSLLLPGLADEKPQSPRVQSSAPDTESAPDEPERAQEPEPAQAVSPARDPDDAFRRALARDRIETLDELNGRAVEGKPSPSIYSIPAGSIAEADEMMFAAGILKHKPPRLAASNDLCELQQWAYLTWQPDTPLLHASAKGRKKRSGNKGAAGIPPWEEA
jgi:hypothetical protein